MTLAAHVELAAYQGQWYEIASIPSTFQRGCTNTTATYTPEGDNRVTVLNRCRQGGGIVDIRGYAEAESTGSAKLSVNLKILDLFYTGGSPYWVLDVGPKGSDGLYDWAVVGNPSRSFGWILSRETTLSLPNLARAQSILVENGYDLASFKYDPQDDPFRD